MRKQCHYGSCRKKTMAVTIQYPEHPEVNLSFCSLLHAAFHFIDRSRGDLETVAIKKQLEAMPEYGPELLAARVAKMKEQKAAVLAKIENDLLDQEAVDNILDK